MLLLHENRFLDVLCSVFYSCFVFIQCRTRGGCFCVEADEQSVLYSGRISWLQIVFSANTLVFSSLKVIFRQDSISTWCPCCYTWMCWPIFSTVSFLSSCLDEAFYKPRTPMFLLFLMSVFFMSLWVLIFANQVLTLAPCEKPLISSASTWKISRHFLPILLSYCFTIDLRLCHAWLLLHMFQFFFAANR